MTAVTVASLPHALHGRRLADRIGDRKPAVFLDYDGVLTPIVDRPEDAVMSESMRATVRELASRCPVCIVSGRDRRVVQQLMGLDELVVAGSHGFDIWSPNEGSIMHDAAAGYEGLIERVSQRLQEEVGDVGGVVIERKHASVAVHYRLADPDGQARVETVVRDLLAEHGDELKMTPGKKVYELQPKIDWNKGKAVLYLIEVLGLDSPDVVPIYLGDDITDEDAFRALRGRGIGIIVGHPDDHEVSGRPTAADFVLSSTEEVQGLLATLAR